VDRLSSGECRTEASKRPLRANEQVMIGNGGEAKFMTNIRKPGIRIIGLIEME
jgi:hypothetical protein